MVLEPLNQDFQWIGHVICILVREQQLPCSTAPGLGMLLGAAHRKRLYDKMSMGRCESWQGLQDRTCYHSSLSCCTRPGACGANTARPMATGRTRSLGPECVAGIAPVRALLLCPLTARCTCTSILAARACAYFWLSPWFPGSFPLAPCLLAKLPALQTTLLTTQTPVLLKIWRLGNAEGRLQL